MLDTVFRNKKTLQSYYLKGFVALPVQISNLFLMDLKRLASIAV